MGMFVNESSYVSKLLLPLKIREINKKNGIRINNMGDLIKNHGNPGLKKYIEKSNDIDEIKYIIKDTRTIFSNLEKIKERIKLCKSKGKNDTTKSYYEYIKKNYIDNGITEKDVEKTIDGQNELINAGKERIKELKQASKNESFELYNSTDTDLLEMMEMNSIFNEDYIEEGLLFNKLPKELESLKIKLKEASKIIYKEERSKYSIKDKLRINWVKNVTEDTIIKSLKKYGITPQYMTVETFTAEGSTSYTYTAFFKYKNYIVSVSNTNGFFGWLKVLYNEDECEIPKNIAFDLFDTMKSLSKYSFKKSSVSAGSLYSNISKDTCNKMQNKYSEEYNVKRNILTDTVTISIKK